MNKKKILSIGITLLSLGAMVLASGCYATTTGTDTTGTTTTTTNWTSLIPMLLFIVFLFGMMYFFTIRPQRKRQQEAQKMLSELGRGDKVITNAGIYGQIESVYDDSFLIKTDSGATIRIAKWAVVGKQPEEVAKTS